MWGWGDELVVGFTLGYHKTVERGHARDKGLPFLNVQARSLDGGQTWRLEDFKGEQPGGRGLSADEHLDAGLRLKEALDDHPPTLPTRPLSFSHPEFALMAARTGLERGARSFFYASYDRCRSWQGPYRLPMFGETGIAARTDYVILGDQSALLFLTANKADGEEGKVICVRTEDGGQSFQRVAQVGAEPTGSGDFAIMPAGLLLPGGRILCALRCRRGYSGASWIDLYASGDLGRSWSYLNQPVSFREPGHSGNPPCLLRLPDGRTALIYGNRDRPYRICARISDDDAVTWGDEITLRAGAANGDIGYARALVLPDGNVVAAYYINDRADGDGERFIEATIWMP